MYEYSARLKHRDGRHAVYDGDTFRLEVDVGFGIFVDIGNARLRGINTPEVRGAEKVRGKEVRDVVKKLFDRHVYAFGNEHSEWFTVRTHKDDKGKYGRYLVDVVLLNDAGELYDLTTYLIEQGHGTVPNY